MEGLERGPLLAKYVLPYRADDDDHNATAITTVSGGQLEGSEDHRILAKPGLEIRNTEASRIKSRSLLL